MYIGWNFGKILINTGTYKLVSKIFWIFFTYWQSERNISSSDIDNAPIKITVFMIMLQCDHIKTFRLFLRYLKVIINLKYTQVYCEQNHNTLFGCSAWTWAGGLNDCDGGPYWLVMHNCRKPRTSLSISWKKNHTYIDLRFYMSITHSN